MTDGATGTGDAGTPTGAGSGTAAGNAGTGQPAGTGSPSSDRTTTGPAGTGIGTGTGAVGAGAAGTSDGAGTAAAAAAGGDGAAAFEKEKTELLRRIKEESGKRTALEAQLQTANTQSAEFDKRLKALAGVDAVAGVDPDIQAVRDNLELVYPGIGKLLAKAETLLALEGRVEANESGLGLHWQNFGRQAIDTVFNRLKATSGIKDLPPETQSGVRMLFNSYLQDEKNAIRYASSDPTLLDEFITLVEASFITPLRSQQVTTESRLGRRRAQLPTGGGSGTTGSQVQQREKPKSVREAVDRMAELMEDQATG